MHKRLDFAYKASSEEAKRQSHRYKAYYDQTVHENKLDVGDRVLVEKLGIKGKHKIADKWEAEPDIIMDQPISDIPVFSVKREDRQGHLRMLHRNQLLPFSGLPAPIVDDNGPDSDGESDTDITILEETAKDVPDSDPYLLQDHTSSSEFDKEPDDTSLQVKKRPRQRRSGKARVEHAQRRPWRQPKPPRWMATGDWLL